jgi:hypothetical protein
MPPPHYDTHETVLGVQPVVRITAMLTLVRYFTRGSRDMLGTQLSENQHGTNHNNKSARYKGQSNQLPPQIRISIAQDSDRDSIYALRHEVYAEECTSTRRDTTAF